MYLLYEHKLGIEYSAHTEDVTRRRTQVHDSKKLKEFSCWNDAYTRVLFSCELFVSGIVREWSVRPVM